MTAFNSHDVEKILSLYTNDCTIEEVATEEVYHGIQEARKYFSEMFKSFPDIKMEFKTDFKADDWAANEWVVTGTNTGNLKLMENTPEMPPTNKKFNFKGATILYYQGDKVNRQTGYWSLATFMQQLGLAQSRSAK